MRGISYINQKFSTYFTFSKPSESAECMQSVVISAILNMLICHFFRKLNYVIKCNSLFFSMMSLCVLH